MSWLVGNFDPVGSLLFVKKLDLKLEQRPHFSENLLFIMASMRLQPLALIDKCIGSKIWVIMKVLFYCLSVC